MCKCSRIMIPNVQWVLLFLGFQHTLSVSNKPRHPSHTLPLSTVWFAAWREIILSLEAKCGRRLWYFLLKNSVFIVKWLEFWLLLMLCYFWLLQISPSEARWDVSGQLPERGDTNILCQQVPNVSVHEYRLQSRCYFGENCKPHSCLEGKYASVGTVYSCPVVLEAFYCRWN